MKQAKTEIKKETLELQFEQYFNFQLKKKASRWAALLFKNVVHLLAFSFDNNFS